MTKQPHHVDIQVGTRIRQARVMRGMSQSGLGEQIGVTFQQLQKYEKGTNRVSASKLVAISEALSLEPSYFVEGLKKPEAEAVGPEQEWQFSKQGRDLVEAFYQIKDQEVRKRIVSLVRQLASTGHSEEGDV